MIKEVSKIIYCKCVLFPFANKSNIPIPTKLEPIYIVYGPPAFSLANF